MRRPNDTQRLSIVGRTGSGKTQAAAWFFSKASWDEKPWVVYDFKRDELLGKIGAMRGTEHIETSETPTKAGIYFVHPHPDDVEQVNKQMAGIWANQDTGVLIDEGYMVSQGSNSRSWLRTLLTQGRSMHIPVIMLSQRPVWLDRFVFSESDFFQVFNLNHSGDRRKLMEYIPADLDQRLPDFHSYYYDVARDETVVLTPVEPEEAILARFEERLDAMRNKSRRVFI